MKVFTLFLALLLVFSFSFNLFAVDEKKIEKRIQVKTTERKAGLGVVVSNISGEVDSKNAIKEGAQIIEVFEGSEAETIGLKKGDILVELNGKKIQKPSDLMDQMNDTEEGEEINLAIIRDGKEMSFKATLKPFSGHAYAFHSGDFDNDFIFDVVKTPHTENYSSFFHTGDKPFMHKKGGYLGVQVKNLSDQLQKYFEVVSGVLIEEVVKDSPAGKAGLMAGDVVISINDRKIEDAEDLVRTINYFNPEEEVEITYNRKGNKKDVTVALAKKPGFSWTTKKALGPRTIEVIEDEGQKAIIIKEGDSFKTIDIRAGDGEELIEVSEEILIF